MNKIPYGKYPIKCGKYPIKCGKYPIKCGKYPIKCGKFPIKCAVDAGQLPGHSILVQVIKTIASSKLVIDEIVIPYH